MFRIPARRWFIALLYFAWFAAAFAAPSAPAGLNAASLTATSFNLRWSAATGGSGGIVGYDIFRDGSLVGSTAGTVRTFAVTGLSPVSSYAVSVMARDGSGALSPSSAPLVVTTPADTTVPSRPTDLAATAITTSSCMLNWSAPTDNVGVTGYTIYRSGVSLGNSSMTTFEVTGLNPDSNSSLTVRAVDAVGNLSAASVALAVHTLAMPPSVPTGLASSNLKATSFALTWAAATGGTGGIASYDVYQNGTLIGSSVSGRTFAVSGLAPLTTYLMTVISRDTTGNVSPASVALEVTTPADTTAPTRPADLAASNVTTTSFALTWTGSTDNVGVTGYNLYRSGVQLGTSAGNSFEVTGLIPDSTNNITVRAVDAAGNLSAASAALSVRMVALPPSTPTGLTIAALRPSSFTLQWSASTGGTGGIKGYEVYLNGILVGSPTTRSLALSGLAPQTSYSMTVASHDSVGNVSEPSVPLVVSTPADTTKPTIPKGLSADQVNPTSFTLIWTASTDNVGVVGYEVYRNNLLIGSTPTPAFLVSRLAPATLSSMRVKAKDAAGNISGFSAILPVTTSALPNVPPNITLDSPADNSAFTLPFTLTLSATAADSDGTIAKVEFFDNGSYLGETTAPVSGQPGIWLLTLSSPLSAGFHSLTARATDNRNATADSNAVVITVNNPNSSPSITITVPPDGTGLVAPGFVTLTADATDSDGVITKVEFYEGGNLLGTVLTPTASPSTFAFPLTLFSTGTYTLTAVATDNSTAQASSAPVVINVNSGAAELPYVANFEPAEGYRTGPLAGQLSWVATGGVTVDPSATPGSQQELAIAAAQPAEILSHDFSASGISPVYVDFRARPVAGASPDSAMIFSTPAAQVALVGTNSPADLWIFGGAGLGWLPSGQAIATDGDGRTTEWIRLTTREDYLQKKWDLYLNGRMISADVPFADANAASLTDFSVNGHATSASAFDSFNAGPKNPLFTDENHNGIDDAWEAEHLLSLDTDNRQLSPAGNGVTVLQAYLAGTDPRDFYNGTTPTLAIVSGNNQTAAPSQFNAQPLVVLVTNSAGAPLANAPVTFNVTTGGGLLSSATTSGPLSSTLSLRTALDGTVQAYFQQPVTPGGASQINALAGTAEVAFQTATENSADTVLFNFNFESQEGFSIGSIGDQNGWQIKWGAGEIVAEAAAPSGAQVASISGTSAILCNLPTPLSGQCTVDFYARLAAGDSGYSATNFIVGEAGVALVLNSAGNEAEVYTTRYNDYAGVYGVAATGAMVPIDAEGRSGWLHFRFKLNFDQSQWDLYLDNTLIAASRPLSISQARTIQLVNGTSAEADIDLISGSAPYIDPDANRNGLADEWEIQNFGYVEVDPGADPDGDEHSNLQEFQNGTDPNDYYNGTTPQLMIVSGDNQTAPAGQFDPLPLKVSLQSQDGTRPLMNASVTFTVAANAGLLSETKSTNALKTSISVNSDDKGNVQVYYLQPATMGTSSQVNVTAGGAQVSFTTSSSTEPIDPNNPTDADGNNLPDGWETTYLGLLKYSPNDDPFGAGRTLRESYQQGLDPHNTALSSYIEKPPVNDSRPGPFIAIPLVLPSTTRSRYSIGMNLYAPEIDHAMDWGLCLNDRGQVFGRGVPDSYIWENGEWTLAYPANSSTGLTIVPIGDRMHESTYFMRTYKTAMNNSGEIVGYDGSTGHFGLYLNGKLERLLWQQASETPEVLPDQLHVVSVDPLGLVSGQSAYLNNQDRATEVRWWESDPAKPTTHWGILKNDHGDSVCIDFGVVDWLSFKGRDGKITKPSVVGMPKSFIDNGNCLLVGSETVAGDVYTGSSFVWSGPAGQVIPIPGSHFGQTWFDPTAISNGGDIVGRWWDNTSYTAGAISHPIVQRNGANFDLYDLISNKSTLESGPSDPKLFGFSPLAINKRGQILIADYRETAYLLTPTADIARLAVDANRDGKIIPRSFVNLTRTPDLVDETTPEKPYRFWINDDIDKGDTGGSDIPGQPDNPSGIPSSEFAANYHTAEGIFGGRGIVNGARDLIDFFPVYMDVKQLLAVLPPTAPGVKYRLKHEEGALNFVYTRLKCSESLKYQHEECHSEFGDDLDKPVTEADTRHITPEGFELSEEFLTGIQRNDWGVILVEARTATDKPLVLSVEKAGALIVEIKLELRISPVEDMFRHLNLRNGRDAPAGLIGQTGDGHAAIATNMSEPKEAYPDEPGDPQWLIFVHGYNVSGEKARGWTSEMFKRFYWSQNKARFVGVTWFGNPGTGDHNIVKGYHWAVRNAVPSAQALAAKINALPGGKTVIGHSQGCWVTALAIADYGLSISNLCLVDAAFAQECLEGDSATDKVNMVPSEWQAYPAGTWSANWYRHFTADGFPSSDARSTLTWNSRLASALDRTAVSSFYSSTEDVLATYPGTIPAAVVENAFNAFADWDLSNLGNYAWVSQEKTKGSKALLTQGSDYGGWGPNLTDRPNGSSDPIYYWVNGAGGRFLFSPSELPQLDVAMVRRAPIFDPGYSPKGGAFRNYDPWVLRGPNWIQQLYDTTSDTASGGAIAATHRTELLAEAFPALSLPVGANRTPALGGRNYDMPVLFANQSNWPRGRKDGTRVAEWHHSDIRVVAYIFQYGLFDKLTTISNQ